MGEHHVDDCPIAVAFEVGRALVHSRREGGSPAVRHMHVAEAGIPIELAQRTVADRRALVLHRWEDEGRVRAGQLDREPDRLHCLPRERDDELVRRVDPLCRRELHLLGRDPPDRGAGVQSLELAGCARRTIPGRAAVSASSLPASFVTA